MKKKKKLDCKINHSNFLCEKQRMKGGNKERKDVLLVIMSLC